MHSALEAIRQATEQTPFEGRVWLVGGALRDELLGRPLGNDLDLVVEGHSAAGLAHLLSQAGASSIEPVEYPRFGTAMVRCEGANVELVTARRESYGEDSRKPEVVPATLEEDAARRDFTVNTLLRNLHSSELRDPSHLGLEDLKGKLLRTPLEPATTFYDDPLRMLRAVRFRWQLGFEPAPGLYEAIKQESGRLEIISAERIRDELIKMLALKGASNCMRDLLELGLLHQFAPEFEAMVGVDQGNYHHLDVWEHTLLVLEGVGPGDLPLSLAALTHDLAKPSTKSFEPTGRVRFFSHEIVGAEMARKLLERLRFPGSDIDAVVKLVRNHMRLGSAQPFTDSAARRLIRDMGEDLDRLLNLCEADAAGHKPTVPKLDVASVRQKIAEVGTVTPAHKLESPLTGAEIMAATGETQGPKIGQLKQMLVESVLDGRLQPGDKLAALKMLEAGKDSSE